MKDSWEHLQCTILYALGFKGFRFRVYMGVTSGLYWGYLLGASRMYHLIQEIIVGLSELYGGYIRVILGLSWAGGKQNGNYSPILPLGGL